jgi:hypothetical protein
MRLHLIGLFAALWMAPVLAGTPDDPTLVRPLLEGARTPAFSARTVDGTLRTYSPDGYRNPTIVLFYPGAGAPTATCNSTICAWSSPSYETVRLRLCS